MKRCPCGYLMSPDAFMLGALAGVVAGAAIVLAFTWSAYALFFLPISLGVLEWAMHLDLRSAS